MSEQLLQTDYERAKRLYSTEQPRLVGRLALAQNDAQQLPIDLDMVYDAAFETILREPRAAQAYAKTFGKLSVGVALDVRPTSFTIDRTDAYRPAAFAEIATKATKNLSQQLAATETDSRTTYLLATDGETLPTELALVQALHMIDTALVTEQFDGLAPLVQTISSDELLRLRSLFPEAVFLRLYGNARQLDDAPQILGSVVPTTLLEKSGAKTQSLQAQKRPAGSTRERITLERQPAAFVGITTAKMPHIGHGFLLVKALAAAGKTGQVVIELNDNGPRVEQAIAALAKDKNTTPAHIAQAVSEGTISLAEIQAAYMNRQSTSPTDLPSYSLRAANDYYRSLLTQIMPRSARYQAIADSELSPLLQTLQNAPGFTPLFGDSGMALLGDQNKNALVLTQKNKPSLAGILGALSTRFALRLIDSPPVLSANERAIFKANKLTVEQDTGTGVMINFELASGTKGNAMPLEQLVDYILTQGADNTLLLPALRIMMNSAYLLPSEGASLSVNFASLMAMQKAFRLALQKASSMQDPDQVLYEPYQPKEQKRAIVRSVIEPVITVAGLSNKPTVGQLKQLLMHLPMACTAFSSELVTFATTTNNSAETIPKQLLQQSDRQLIQALLTANPTRVIPLLTAQDDSSFAELTHGSKLPEVATRMGYDPTTDNLRTLLGTLQSIKGIYTL